MTPIKCFYFDHSFDSSVNGPCCFLPIPGATDFKTMKSSPVYIEIKQSFDQGQWPDRYCNKCRDVETTTDIENPQRSKRQNANDNKKVMVGDINDSDALHYLTLDTGRLCNLQCRSCNPTASSSWIDEHNFLLTGTTNSINRHNPSIYGKNLSFKVWPTNSYDYSAEDFSQVRYINLLGGEPLYNTSANGILELIADATNGNCRVSTNTNGTIEFELDRHPWMKRFKEVILITSIDGINDAFDFIRTGGRWSTVVKNLNLYKSNTNLNLAYHPTFSILNLLEIPDLFEWADSFGLPRTNEVTYLEEPNCLSFNILTDEEKEIAISYAENNNYRFIIPRIKASTFDLRARKLFHEYMEHTKSYHDLDWKDYLPKLYKLLNKV
jgi:MoaA/NifB/PqqE/SkfB family radical SAM enzyme